MNPWVKKYVFMRMFGASDKRARKGIEMLGFDRRKTGRIIRVGRRAWAKVRAIGEGYRSYDEQRRLYDRWKASGRGVVAAPVTDFQAGSHFFGRAIDTEMSKGEMKRIVDKFFVAYPHLMPIRDGRAIVSIPGGGA